MVWECLNPGSSAFSAFGLGLVGGCKLQQWHGDRSGVAGRGNGDMRKKLTIPKTPKSREPLDPKKPMAKMKVFNP